MWNPFKAFFPKKMVGVDIGTSSIKIVEISRWGQGKTLENYGQVYSDAIFQELPTAIKGVGGLSHGVLSGAIKAVLEEAKIKTKAAVFSIPDFSTFCTSFSIPAMPEKEIPGAIMYNASQYITLPISEVALDWKILPATPGENGGLLKVFLVAIPNQVIQEYQIIAKEAGLHLYALEAEALAIARSLAKDIKKVVCVIDIGVQSTTINIVDGGFLRRSYSSNFYSSQLSKAVSSALGVQVSEAEIIKNKEGITSVKQGVAQTLHLLIDPLLVEVKGILAEFYQQEQKEVREIYITGGTANLPGLREYFAEYLGKTTLVPNCFADFLYPPILEESLREMNPGFSVAVGAALGGLQT